MIPAALHQRPQGFCEGWVCRPWWSLALRDGQHGRESWKITERDRASEYLYRYKREPELRVQ